MSRLGRRSSVLTAIWQDDKRKLEKHIAYYQRELEHTRAKLAARRVDLVGVLKQIVNALLHRYLVLTHINSST